MNPLRLLTPVMWFFAILVSACAAEPVRERTILIVGDSLTAGYGLPDPATQAYPALLQARLDALPAPGWRIVNAGVSGDTTSGGLRRIDWVTRQPVAILVLALGANDGLRGLPLDLIRANLSAIVAKVRAKNPQVRVLLAGMRMPTSMGDYARDYAGLFTALARAENWGLVPFLLEDVGGVAELNQADGIHPNEDGHKIVADKVWPHLLVLL
ncbi:MAG: arylesterase [Verrucomicrobia bacterium]|nr:arylesterase [Verrucomicrobiota bacterium]